jgi:hypothetical protein
VASVAHVQKQRDAGGNREQLDQNGRSRNDGREGERADECVHHEGDGPETSGDGTEHSEALHLLRHQIVGQAARLRRRARI